MAQVAAEAVVVAGERIAQLRQRVLARKTARQGGGIAVPDLLRWQLLHAVADQGSWQRRCGHATKGALASCRFALDELELLAGRPLAPSASPPLANWPPELQQLVAAHPAPGQTGHAELHLATLQQVGLAALRVDLRQRAATLSGAPQDALESFALALDGLEQMILHAADSVAEAMAGASPARQEELRETLASCRRIASAPPQTFMDGLHLLWFATMGVQYAREAGLLVPGHMDRTLLGLYRADRAAGRLSEAQALLLLECFYLHINEFVSDGLAMSVMVGGCDAAGRDVTNELSYLCLEALRRTKLCYPTVGVCWHAGTPEALTDLAVELITKGYTTPAFFGDALIQRGLQSYGVPPDEACNYINSTCVEITPVGGSNVWVASPYFSLCQLLLDEIAAQVAAPTPCADFDAFLAAYFARLAARISAAVVVENRSRELRRLNDAKPLQSLLTRDCVARARDINDGGARYNWVECSFVGIANLADALLVLKREVFATRALTLAQVKRVLDSNFAAAEELRRRWLHAHPKYGTGHPEVDALVGVIVARCADECSRHRVQPDDSPFVPGAFCWIMHERLGRDCGATPDGRPAGFPFADGAGPAQGRETQGPTASILSTSSWDHTRLMGGTALNLRFSSSLCQGTQGPGTLKALIKTYLQRGGLETQINVVDRATLLAARAHPEAYRDLVVRIGGYTDYFTRLSPQMQDEVLQRTEFARF